jgi:hypothetical protein
VEGRRLPRPGPLNGRVDRVKHSRCSASACDADHALVVLCCALLPAEGVREGGDDHGVLHVRPPRQPHGSP